MAASGGAPSVAAHLALPVFSPHPLLLVLLSVLPSLLLLQLCRRFLLMLLFAVAAVAAAPPQFVLAPLDETPLSALHLLAARQSPHPEVHLAAPLIPAAAHPPRHLPRSHNPLPLAPQHMPAGVLHQLLGCWSL